MKITVENSSISVHYKIHAEVVKLLFKCCADNFFKTI